MYYISTIASGASIIPCIFMKESNAQQLLQAKVKAVRNETGENDLKAEGSHKMPSAHCHNPVLDRYNARFKTRLDVGSGARGSSREDGGGL